MYHTFSILFIFKEIRPADGKAPIYLRITVNGKRSQMSISRKIELSRWNSQAGRARGTNTNSRELNQFIDTIKHKLYRIQENLQSNNRSFSIGN